MGVGSVYPEASTAWSTFSLNPSSENDIRLGTASGEGASGSTAQSGNEWRNTLFRLGCRDPVRKFAGTIG
jgi:hypothetical protein